MDRPSIIDPGDFVIKRAEGDGFIIYIVGGWGEPTPMPRVVRGVRELSRELVKALVTAKLQAALPRHSINTQA